ncbi:MAG: oligosaccharide flippase family protein [Candidatus Hodarchaeota archaeon]
MTVRGISALLLLRIFVEIIGKFRTFFIIPFLTPEDFGLRALGIFVFTLAGLPLWGWGMHIITEEEDLEEMYTVQTAFIISFWGVMGLIVILLRDSITNFYKATGLSSILIFYALINIFHGTAAGSKLKLSKTIQHESIAKISMITNIISLISTIYLAYSGYGVWSLILGNHFAKSCWTIMNIKLAGLPLKRFNKRHIKNYFRRGSSFNILSICITILFNIDDGIVGYLSGVEQLGYYSLAFGIGLLLSQFIVGPFRTVMFPALAKITHEQRVIVFARALELISILLIGVSLVTFFFIETIILFFFGEGWLILSSWGRWFVIFGLIQGLVSTLNNFLMVRKRVFDMIKIRLVQFALLFALGIPTTYLYGPIGMIVAQNCHVFFALIIEARIASIEAENSIITNSFYVPLASLAAALGTAILLQLTIHPSMVALGIMSISIYTFTIILMGRKSLQLVWQLLQESVGH